MTRRTSIESYREMKELGLLSKERLMVYYAIMTNGPCTSGEAYATMGKTPRNRTRTRELCDLGVIDEVGERRCRITNRPSILWQVNGNLPDPDRQARMVAERKQQREADILNKCESCRELSRQVTELQQQVAQLQKLNRELIYLKEAE